MRRKCQASINILTIVVCCIAHIVNAGCVAKAIKLERTYKPLGPYDLIVEPAAEQGNKLERLVTQNQISTALGGRAIWNLGMNPVVRVDPKVGHIIYWIVISRRIVTAHSSNTILEPEWQHRSHVFRYSLVSWNKQLGLEVVVEDLPLVGPKKLFVNASDSPYCDPGSLLLSGMLTRQQLNLNGVDFDRSRERQTAYGDIHGGFLCIDVAEIMTQQNNENDRQSRTKENIVRLRFEDIYFDSVLGVTLTDVKNVLLVALAENKIPRSELLKVEPSKRERLNTVVRFRRYDLRTKLLSNPIWEENIFPRKMKIFRDFDRINDKELLGFGMYRFLRKCKLEGSLFSSGEPWPLESIKCKSVRVAGGSNVGVTMTASPIIRPEDNKTTIDQNIFVVGSDLISRSNEDQRADAQVLRLDFRSMSRKSAKTLASGFMPVVGIQAYDETIYVLTSAGLRPVGSHLYSINSPDLRAK